MPPVTPPTGRVPAPQARLGPAVRLVSGDRVGGPRVPSPTLRTDPPLLPSPLGNPDLPYTIEPAPPAAYSPLGMLLSLVALVALLVAVVATSLCYHRWQKGKERRHLAVAYRAGQTDTSDYMVPGQHRGRGVAPAPRWPSGTRLTPVPPDVPPSHHAHYYSNPSYHTLSQCPLSQCPLPQDRASSLKVQQAGTGQHGVCGAPLPPPSRPTCPLFGLQVPGTQLFPGMERPYSPEGNATLPPDWKHLGPRGKEEVEGQLQSGVGT